MEPIVQGSRAVIGDFGISKYDTPSLFQAPEVLEHSTISCPADLFALGIILCMMCMKKTDSQSLYPNIKSISRAVVDGQRPILSSTTCAPWLCAVIQFCWSDEPLERPSAAALVQLMEAHVGDLRSNREIMDSFRFGIDSVDSKTKGIHDFSI